MICRLCLSLGRVAFEGWGLASVRLTGIGEVSETIPVISSSSSSKESDLLDFISDQNNPLWSLGVEHVGDCELEPAIAFESDFNGAEWCNFAFKVLLRASL